MELLPPGLSSASNSSPDILPQARPKTWSPELGVAVGGVVTVIPRQVCEGQWLAAHPVRESLQEDIDSHRLCNLQVLIGWCLEHNGNLPVHVRLREVSSAFPGSCAEHHRYVLWWG